MSLSDILMILFAFGGFLIALLTFIIDLIEKMTKK
ncbi:TPA: putative holin-like toxin [Enterococcus faecium]|nr:putative holin-like toxin [Enterococcus gallinarum]MCD5186856.1 putative holin-like toxin [Enterococcus gallinarum]